MLRGRDAVDETLDPDRNSRSPSAAVCASPTALSWFSIRSQPVYEDLRQQPGSCESFNANLEDFSGAVEHPCLSSMMARAPSVLLPRRDVGGKVTKCVWETR